MATEDIVGGLFGVNPAMYQQQQQQQVFNRAVALQNLDPFQQAAVGYQQAGYNLAGALGGALGGVDPQLQRISALNAISKQIDQSSPESMMSGAKMLADAGFTQEALGLAQYARKANSELALAQQRMKEGRAAGVNKDIQIAEYTATLRNAIKQLKAGPPSSETDNQIAELQGRLDALPQQKTDSIFANINPSDYTPESIKAFVLSKNYGDLIPKTEKGDAVSTNIQDSLEIGRLVGEIDKLNKSPEGSKDLTKIKQLEAQLKSLTKNTKQGEFAQILQDAGYIPGSEDYINKMKEFVNLKLAEKPETKTEAMKNAIAFADLSSFKKGSREYNMLVKEKFDEFVAKADRANIAEIGVSPKGDAVYFDKNTDQQFIVKIEGDKTVRVPYAGSVNRATSNVSASATATGAKQEAAFETGLGTGQSKRVMESQERAQAAADILATNEVGRSLLNSGAITGAGADFFVGLNKALKQAGIDFGYADAASNSQAYAAAMAANAGQLIKQFGAGTGLSDADREYATKAAAGQISMDETAIRKVLDINDRAARNIIKRHNQSVKGIKTNIPLEVEIPAAPPPPALSGAAAIPTGKPAATAIPQAAIDALKAGQGTDAQFDEQFGAGAAKRVRGAK